MAALQEVSSGNHLPGTGNDRFIVYSKQFNDLVQALTAGTGDIVANDATISGNLTVTGITTLNGALILGDAAADTLTINATATYVEPINYDNATTITAFATGGQASATALTAEINNVTTVATAGDSVKLPAAVAGKHVRVKNSGATALDIFPASADSIDALAINLAIRIQPGSTVDFYAKDTIVWESSVDETFTLVAPTTNTGALVLKAAASGGNFTTTVVNASQAAARIYTIPDAGADASFVLTAGSQTIAGSKTFSDPIIQNDTTNQIVLGVTNTTTINSTAPSASRVVTLPDAGTNSNFLLSEGNQTINGVQTFGSANIYKALTSQTALAGGAQAGTALTAEYTNFTTVATALDSAQLPTPVLGTKRIVKNSSSSKLPMIVYPQTGATIDNGAANDGAIIAYGQTEVFEAISATAWLSRSGNATISTPIITETRTATATEIVGNSAEDLGHASGFTLVNAPGANYALKLIGVTAFYDFNTAAYTGGGDDTSIRLGGGGAAITGIVTSANLLGAASDKVVRFDPLSTAALPITGNVAISAVSTTAWTQPGTAAGTVRFVTQYQIVSLR